MKDTDFLKNFGGINKPLTPIMHRTARDAGFSLHEFGDQRWYQTIVEQIKYEKGGRGPALPKQLEFFALHEIEITLVGLTYSEARKLTREVAKMHNDDPIYLQEIAKEEAVEYKKKTRSDSKVTPITKNANKTPKNGDILDSLPTTKSRTFEDAFADEEDDDDEDTAFFKTLKKNPAVKVNDEKAK